MEKKRNRSQLGEEGEYQPALKRRKVIGPTASLDSDALSMTLEELQKGLNSTDEGKVQKTLRLFQRRIELEDKKEAHVAGAEGESSSVPLVVEYINSSPHCQELTAIWEVMFQKDRAKTQYTAQLLDTMATLIRACTQPHTPSKVWRSATDFARKILKHRLNNLITNLGSDFNVLVNSTLRLLTALVLSSPAHARELFSNFNFAFKPIARLVDKRQRVKEGQDHHKPNVEHDVRTNFVRFTLSFLKTPDDSLKEQVMGIKGFLGGIFKSLPTDHISLVKEIATALIDGIVLNKNISKKSKSFFFNTYVLEHLVATFTRYTINATTKEEEAAGEILYRLLYELCCSYSHGILYRETVVAVTETTESGTTSSQHQHKNPLVVKVLHELRPTEHKLHESLVLSILNACSALKRDYFNWLRLPMEPKPTLKWHRTITFLQRLMIRTAPIDNSFYIAMFENTGNTVQAADKMCVWILPISINRQTLSQCLQHSDRLVQTAAMSLVVAMLIAISNAREHLSGAVHTSECTALMSALRRRLPDLQILLQVLRKNEANLAAEASNALDGQEQRPLRSDALCLIVLKALTHYVRLFPETIVESHIDFGKLAADGLQLAPTAQQQCIELLYEALPSLHWNTGFSNKVTLIGALLRLLLSTPSEFVYNRAYGLCYQLLRKTNLFERTDWEIDIWLRHLTLHSIPYFELLLTVVSESSIKYTDKLQQFMMENGLQSDAPPFSIISAAALFHLTQPVPLPQSRISMFSYTPLDAVLCTRRVVVSTFYMSGVNASQFLAAVGYFTNNQPPSKSNLSLKRQLKYILSCLPLPSEVQSTDLDALEEALEKESAAGCSVLITSLSTVSEKKVFKKLPVIAEKAARLLSSVQPLSDFLCATTRSVFDNTQFVEIITSQTAVTDSNTSLLHKLLAQTQTSVLLQHLFTAERKDLALQPAAVDLLVQSLSRTPPLVAIRACLFHASQLVSSAMNALDEHLYPRLALCFVLLELVATRDDINETLLKEIFTHPTLFQHFLQSNTVSEVLTYLTFCLMSSVAAVHPTKAVGVLNELLCCAVGACKRALQEELMIQSPGKKDKKRRRSTSHTKKDNTMLLAVIGNLECVMKSELRSQLTSLLLDFGVQNSAALNNREAPPFFDLLLRLLEGPALHALAQTAHWSPAQPFWKSIVHTSHMSNQASINISSENFRNLLELGSSKLINGELKQRIDTIICGCIASELTAAIDVHNSSSNTFIEMCDIKHVKEWLSPFPSREGAVAAALLIASNRHKGGAHAEFILGTLKHLVKLAQKTSDIHDSLLVLAPTIVASLGPLRAIAFDNWLQCGGDASNEGLEDFGPVHKVIEPLVQQLMDTVVEIDSKDGLAMMLLAAARCVVRTEFYNGDYNQIFKLGERIMNIKRTKKRIPVQHLLLMEEIIRVLARNDDVPKDKLADMMSAFVQQVCVSALKKSVAIGLNILSRLNKYASFLLAASSKHVVVDTVKTILRHTYDRAEGFMFIANMVVGSRNYDGKIATDIHDLVVSHSHFINVLLAETPETRQAVDDNLEDDEDMHGEISTQDNTVAQQNAKIWMLKLLYCLYDAAPSLLETRARLVRVYLAAYRASVAEQDLLLLAILQQFERQNVSISEAGGLLWGQHAQDRMKERKRTAGTSNEHSVTLTDEELLQDLEVARGLFYDGKIIQLKRVQATLKNFTVARPLDVKISDIHANSQLHELTMIRRPGEVYDVAFILPWLAKFLDVAAPFDSKKFVDCGALSLALIAFSSQDESVRKLAYHITAVLTDALSKATFKEQPQLMWFLECVKDAVFSPARRIPTITASFIAHTVLVLSRADHHLFIPISEWMLSRAQILDLENSVPMFSKLFMAQPTHHGRDREWLLRVILAGMRSPNDLTVLQAKQLLSIMCTHAASRVVSTDRDRDVIWRIIDRALISDSLHKQTIDHGILAWMCQLISNPSCSPIAFRHACISVQTILSLSDIEKLAKSTLLSNQVQLLCISILNTLERLKGSLSEEDKWLALNVAASMLRVFAAPLAATVPTIVRLVQQLRLMGTQPTTSTAPTDLFVTVTQPAIVRQICADCNEVVTVVCSWIVDNFSTLASSIVKERWHAKATAAFNAYRHHKCGVHIEQKLQLAVQFLEGAQSYC